MQSRLRLARTRLAAQKDAVAGLGAQNNLLKRRWVHAASRSQKPSADGDGLGKRARSILQGGKHKVSQRMVAREGKTVFERSRERVGIIRGHGSEAFADVARRKHAGLFAQNAGGTAVVRHSHHGRHLCLEGKQRTYGNGGSGAAADDNRLDGSSCIVQGLLPHFGTKARKGGRRRRIVSERKIAGGEFRHGYSSFLESGVSSSAQRTDSARGRSR